MKILFYLHRYPAIGGIEGVTTFLANSFANLQYDVRIVSHFGIESQENGLVSGKEISIKHLPSPRCHCRKNRHFLQSEIRAFRPDVIIFQDSYAPIESNLFPVRADVPVIVCEHNSPYAYYDEPNEQGNFLRGAIERWGFPFIKRLKYLRDRKRRYYLYNQCWKYVLLSNRFFGEFRAVARIGDSRKLTAIPNAAPEAITVDFKDKVNEVLFVGAVTRRKGCDILLKVWQRVCHDHPNWKLTIVGDGHLRGVLEEEAKTETIPRVHFEGTRVNPVSYFRRAKIFAFPSRREGWGLVIAEALACGCVPIVFDSFSSVRDNVEDGVNGLLIQPLDVDEFASKLSMLMEDDELLQRMARAKLQSRSMCSQSEVMSQWMQLLLEATAK